MQIHVVVTSVILLYCCSNSTATAAHSFHPHFNNVTDQQSLLQFKAAITSDPHHSLANWNPNLSLCNWTGVTCSSRRQRVVAVELSGMALEGSISPHLANLSFLHSLDLSNNTFHGLIPLQFGRLIRLREVLLYSNGLGGHIPTSLSDCRNLVELDLSDNFLSGRIPAELGLLARLKLLALGGNYLEGVIPVELGELTQLRSLYLGDSNLTGPIPSSLGNLSALTTLQLESSNLEGAIPHQLGMLTNLSALYLYENQLTGSIPSSLGNLSALTDLELATNHLQGAIPHQLGMLTNLSVLYLYENQLTGSIPSSLGNLSALTELVLYTNRLQGVIPHQLGMLTYLSLLSLFQNQLTGSIPSSLGNLSTLTELVLCTNRLQGAIPHQLGMLTNLSLLYLYENQLTGQIPTSLSNCTSLQQLILYDNQLSGHIPNALGNNMLQLRILSLWGNQLSGRIPISLGNCSKLTLLLLNDNQLSGVVPLELGNLPLLQSLYLQDNQLVSSNSSGLPIVTALTNCSLLREIGLHNNQLGGTLPLSIGYFSTKLNILSLSNNSIQGSIPHQLGNLTNLTYLDLSSNLLSGKIPSTFRRLQRLERLYLDYNRLEGSIFNEIDQMEGLGLLSVSNNMLSGRIPDSLGHLQQQLRRLYLHHNQFSERIPKSLGECQNLELLDLSHNRLTGSIPQEIAGLQNLHFYLNLSWNSLQGSLPPEISKIVMALAIDISANQLSGAIPEALGSCIALEYLNLSQNTLQGQIPMSLTKLQNLEVLDLASNFLTGTVPRSFRRLKMLHYIDLSFNNLTGEISEVIFSNSTTVALFRGNPGLCGLHRYSLPACPKQRNHSFLKRKIVAIIGISVFMLFCLILALFFLWRCHLHRRSINLSEFLSAIAKNLEHPRISYEELVDATNGFDETNLLGVGSFGSVYKGILSDGTIVAVKVLNLDNEEARKSFDVECKILRRVRHRNLIQIITSCSNLDFKILVMKFASNGSLEKHLYPDGDKNDPKVVCGMSLSKRLDIATDIAHGMSYLHHDCFMQVVHCDLKPSNLLLDDNMTALVTDFGIARLVGINSLDSLTSTLPLRGSLGYMAPEYGFGTTASTNGDVYSFGIVLLEMLTRKRPVDEIFVDGLTLQKWVRMAFPNRILEVVDKSLLTHHSDNDMGKDNVFNCLVQFIHLGLLCTNECPGERPNMREIVEILERIKEKFVGARRSSLLQLDISSLLSSQTVAGNNMKASESQSSSTF